MKGDCEEAELRYCGNREEFLKLESLDFIFQRALRIVGCCMSIKSVVCVVCSWKRNFYEIKIH